MRMRSLINQCQKTLSGAERRALFHQAKRLYRQALLLTSLNSVTPKTNREFPCCQPVEPLATVSEYSDVHFAEELFNEFRADLRIIIKSRIALPPVPGV